MENWREKDKKIRCVWCVAGSISGVVSLSLMLVVEMP